MEPARVGPTFSIELKNQAIKKGDDVKLKCHVTGNPRPEVSINHVTYYCHAVMIALSDHVVVEWKKI